VLAPGTAVLAPSTTVLIAGIAENGRMSGAMTGLDGGVLGIPRENARTGVRRTPSPHSATVGIECVLDTTRARMVARRRTVKRWTR
jgi:hypothetical protein